MFVLPRRHPKPEESNAPNPLLLKERRERRARKRLAKSPGGRGKGFLTVAERQVIRDHIEAVNKKIDRDGATEDLQLKLKHLRSELRQDEEVAKKPRNSSFD